MTSAASSGLLALVLSSDTIKAVFLINDRLPPCINIFQTISYWYHEGMSDIEHGRFPTYLAFHIHCLDFKPVSTGLFSRQAQKVKFSYDIAIQETETEICCNSGMDKAFEVNVKACTMLLKHSVPLLSQSSQGSVINVSSINARMALEGFVPYAMTKAAILQVTRNAAVDLGPKGIR